MYVLTHLDTTHNTLGNTLVVTTYRVADNSDHVLKAGKGAERDVRLAVRLRYCTPCPPPPFGECSLLPLLTFGTFRPPCPALQPNSLQYSPFRIVCPLSLSPVPCLNLQLALIEDVWRCFGVERPDM